MGWSKKRSYPQAGGLGVIHSHQRKPLRLAHHTAGFCCCFVQWISTPETRFSCQVLRQSHQIRVHLILILKEKTLPEPYPDWSLRQSRSGHHWSHGIKPYPASSPSPLMSPVSLNNRDNYNPEQQMMPRSKFLLFCVNLSELLSSAVVKHQDQGNF